MRLVPTVRSELACTLATKDTAEPESIAQRHGRAIAASAGIGAHMIVVTAARQPRVDANVNPICVSGRSGQPGGVAVSPGTNTFSR